MRKTNNLSMCISGAVLALTSLFSVAYAAPMLAPAKTIIGLSQFLCAPDAAIDARNAAKSLYDDKGDLSQKENNTDNIMQSPAIATAQTVDEDNFSSGYWTQAPKESEIVPQEPAAAPPPEGALPIVTAHYEDGTGERYIPCGQGTIKNCTSLSSGEISAEVLQPLNFAIEKNSALPQVLIMHTHTTETYQLTDEAFYSPDFTARSTDENINMVAVGNEITNVLNAAGINTIHDNKMHDYPSYNGAYARSSKTVKEYLAQYPSIKIVIDVHRDAIQKDDGTRVKPIVQTKEGKAAQIMLICGADKNGNLPNFKQNLRFASAWQAKMAEQNEGFARPLLFDYRFYNQDLTTGSLLIEVGGHANTLNEAKLAGKLAANALASLF